MFPLSLYFSGASVRWTERQLWANIFASSYADEEEMLEQLLELYQPPTAAELQQAEQWLKQDYQSDQENHWFSQIQTASEINCAECVVLTALTERLQLVEHQPTRERLLEDSLNPENWSPEHYNTRLLTNTTTWQVSQQQHLLPAHSTPEYIMSGLLHRLDPSQIKAIIRQITESLFQQLAAEVAINTIDKTTGQLTSQRYCFAVSVNNAVTDKQAKQNFSTCLDSIEAIAQRHPGASVSISPGALHPAFEYGIGPQLTDELSERLLHLLVIAREKNVAVSLDAGHCHQQKALLTLFQRLISNEICQGWGGLGITVQAYSKQTLPVLAWLSFIAEQHHTAIPVRLTKGAFWQNEIHRAQHQGVADYPVYTLKQTTDIAYQVCADYLLSSYSPQLQPQFACHDPLSVTQIIKKGKRSTKTLEFHRLSGFNNKLFKAIIEQYPDLNLCTSIPVGNQSDIISHLLHNRLNPATLSALIAPQVKPEVPYSGSITSPESQLQQLRLTRNSALPALTSQVQVLSEQVRWFDQQQWHAGPLINGEVLSTNAATPCYSPYDLEQQIGSVINSDAEDIREAFSVAQSAFIEWRKTPPETRIAVIRRFAKALEEHANEIISLCISEAGLTLSQATEEIRSAISACMYYCQRARQQLTPSAAASTTTDRQIRYEGLGVFTCLSSAESPLALWATQIIAALLGGNTVVSKPDSQTPLIAFRATGLLIDSGLPSDAISLIPGHSSDTGQMILSDYRSAGVAFNGSARTAGLIAQQRFQNHHALLTPFVATLKSQTIAITDFTKSATQITRYVIDTAFRNRAPANALQILYLPQERVEEVATMLIGQLQQLQLAAPDDFDTDLGALSDNDALQAFHSYIEHYREQGQLLYERKADEQSTAGYYAMPSLVKLETLEQFNSDCFGPVLHLIGYSQGTTERIINELNRSGAPLSLRIISTDALLVKNLNDRIRTSDLQINETCSPAIPFANNHLAATGPKAGSPDYLMNFVKEVYCSIR